MVYIWKNKYQGRYSIQKESNRYIGRQQGYSNAQERIVNKKNNSRDKDNKKKQDD